jgi:aryl-alcohol dehydrogenase-like predicted oxidoreductase
VKAPAGARGSFYEYFGDWYASKRGWKVLDEIRVIADEVGANPAHVSLRWLMDWDDFTCIPIVGARTPELLEENVAVTEADLSDEQWDSIMLSRYDSDGELWR